MTKANKILVICGPTASGKTDLAQKLAKEFSGELIAADSRQVYKGLDIGTGKYAPEDHFKKFSGKWLLNNVWIHGYDIVEPEEQFTAADFEKFFWQIVKRIWYKEKLPILVGGTGFYIKAALAGFETLGVPPNPRLRKKLERLKAAELYKLLQKTDSGKAATLSPTEAANPHRLIRAIEVAEFKKKGSNIVFMYLPATRLLLRRQQAGPYMQKKKADVLRIGLNASRQILYQRIDDRIDLWFQTGFVKEVKKAINKFGSSSPGLITLGYQQVADYLSGKYSLETAIQKVKFSHHNFARRQLTWFRQDRQIIWFDITEKNFYQKVEKEVKKWYSN